MEENEATELMKSFFMEARDQNRIAQWLRSIDSEKRLEFLKQHVYHTAWYRLAVSCVNGKIESYEFFRFGLDAIKKPNSSATKAMTQFGITKLGVRKTIDEIARRIENQPHIVDMALYWLPSLLPKDETKREELNELQQKAEELGIIKPVKRIVNPNGSVTFADRYKP